MNASIKLFRLVILAGTFACLRSAGGAQTMEDLVDQAVAQRAREVVDAVAAEIGTRDAPTTAELRTLTAHHMALKGVHAKSSAAARVEQGIKARFPRIFLAESLRASGIDTSSPEGERLLEQLAQRVAAQGGAGSAPPPLPLQAPVVTMEPSFLTTEIRVNERLAAPLLAPVAPAEKERMLKIDAAAPLDQAALQDSYGLHFGAGLAFLSAIDRPQAVKSATVDTGGALRVEYERNERVSSILETHVIFGRDQETNVDQNQSPTRVRWRHGIFVGLEPGETLARSFGLGYLSSFRKFSKDSAGKVQEGVAFNLGLGIMADLSRQYLPDGFVPNKPLPTGESVRYDKKTQLDAVIMLSAGF